MARELTISIVIPTLNEARCIADVVRHALAHDVEVIVADGGSSDGTPLLAREAGARVVHAPRGRGTQMDAGAAIATGDVLVFLHADTRLPEDAADHIRAALADERVVGGNFYLRYVPFTPAGLVFTAYAHVRRALFSEYGGQSGIFVRRAVFEELGGYGPLPLLEDRVFARRLERAGGTRHLPAWAETSARRYIGREWRALAVWTTIHSLHRVGFPLALVSRLYREIRD